MNHDEACQLLLCVVDKLAFSEARFANGEVISRCTQRPHRAITDYAICVVASRMLLTCYYLMFLFDPILVVRPMLEYSISFFCGKATHLCSSA